MSFPAFYCLAYTTFVDAAPIDMLNSVLWVRREWGPWLIFTPVLLRAMHLRAHQSKRCSSVPRRAGFYLAAAGIVLACSLAYRVGVDWHFHSADPLGSLVYFFPKHAVAFALIVLIWHLRLTFSRPITKASSPDTSTLLVHRGADECLIEIDRIEAVSAAGNYVDIICDSEIYLLRGTLKQLEESLPKEKFIRTHRSHLVNINAVTRIKITTAGNGTIDLRGGKSVAISKKYRAYLKQQTALAG